jgi:hypothetical protein
MLGTPATTLECGGCGELAASPDLTADQLRRATGFVRVDETDYCPGCAGAGPAAA